MTPDARQTSSSDVCSGDRTARRWLVACVGTTAIIALASNGAYHDDDLAHYLYARWTRHDARYLADVWARPGFTLPYALPAQVGWPACRLLSVAVSGLTACAAFRCAQRLGLPRAAWAIPLLYAQPLFLHLSFTTLTETPAAAYLALATWALLAGRPRTSAAVFSLALITRHETIVLLPVWAWAVWRAGPHGSRAGRWAAAALLVWAPLAYNAIAWPVLGQLPGAIFAQPAGAEHYGRGTPLTYLMRFVVMAGPVIAPLSVVGAAAMWRNRAGRPLIVGTAVFIIAETGLYMGQAYSTGGFARFLVPLAPWVAILALAGVSTVGRTATAGRIPVNRWWLPAVAIAFWLAVEVEQHVNPIHAIAPYFRLFRTAAAAIVLGIGLTLGSGWPRHLGFVLVAAAALGPVARAAWPHRLRTRELYIAEAVTELRARGLGDRPFYSTSDWGYHFANRWYPPGWRLSAEDLRKAPAGAVFLWDGRYGPSPVFGWSIESLRADATWREVCRVPRAGPEAPFACVFERVPER